jgi:hypothetical protein
MAIVVETDGLEGYPSIDGAYSLLLLDIIEHDVLV